MLWYSDRINSVYLSILSFFRSYGRLGQTWGYAIRKALNFRADFFEKTNAYILKIIAYVQQLIINY